MDVLRRQALHNAYDVKPGEPILTEGMRDALRHARGDAAWWERILSVCCTVLTMGIASTLSAGIHQIDFILHEPPYDKRPVRARKYLGWVSVPRVHARYHVRWATYFDQPVETPDPADAVHILLTRYISPHGTVY